MRREGRLFGSVLEGRGRKHWNVGGFRERVNRRFSRGHAAAGGTRRLRINRDHVVACADDLGERRHGEIGRAHEDDAQ